MKKLLLKLLVLALAAGIACNLIFYFFNLPRFWGVCYDRFHFYQAHAQNYNTLFIGSSLTRYQVNPVLFDSINALNGIKTTSYNFGVDGACPTELYSTFKYFMGHKPANLKYVFVELTLIDNFDMGQMHSLRRKSSFGINQYVKALPLTLEANYNPVDKARILWFDFCNLADGIYKIGMLKDAYDFKKQQSDLEKISTVKDFMALPVDTNKETADDKKQYAKRHQKFLAESLTELKNNTDNAATMFINPQFLLQAKINHTYINMVDDMQQIAQLKGVTLIFVLPPRLSKENYQDLLPVYFSIPVTNRIELADANKYRDFYTVAYSFDIKHLNQYGVPKFTAALAAGFLNLHICKP